MTSKLSRWLVIALSWYLLASAGAYGQAANKQNRETAPEFVIGAVLDPNINMPLLVADQRGFFKKYGVPATVKLFPSGAEIVQSIAGGSIEFGATGGVPGTILASRGTDVKVIARLGDISYEIGLGVGKNSSIRKPQDIVGKTVAMTNGTSSQYLVIAFARHWGIPLDSFKQVNLGPADQMNALAQGSVQMVSVWEPFASRLKDSGGAIVQTAIRSYWSGAEGPVHLVGDPGILFGREKYLAKYPDTTRNLLLAIDEATMWIRNNPEQAATIAAKALNSTTPAMLAVVKAGYIYFNFDQELVDELRAETLFLKEQGMIPKEFDAESWMAPQYMSGVLADRVTYRPK